MSDNKNLKYNGYIGSIEHSIDENLLYGEILFIKDLVTYESETLLGLKAAFEQSVDEYLAYCESIGMVPNKSLNGTFQIRVGAALHAHAAERAIHDQVSLNGWIQKLVQRDKDLCEQKAPANTEILKGWIQVVDHIQNMEPTTVRKFQGSASLTPATEKLKLNDKKEPQWENNWVTEYKSRA